MTLLKMLDHALNKARHGFVGCSNKALEKHKQKVAEEFARLRNMRARSSRLEYNSQNVCGQGHSFQHLLCLSKLKFRSPNNLFLICFCALKDALYF